MKTSFKTLMLKNNNKGKRNLDTRPDLPECPRQYQHFFLSELLDWVAEQGAERDWDKERVCQNVEQWIYYFDMFSIEGII